MMRSAAILMISVLALVACNQQDSGSVQKSQADSLKEARAVMEQSTTRMITLPTPMQIPALLKNTRATYDPTSLLTIVEQQNSYFTSGVLFGAYMIDLAYTSSYSHQQASREYFKACRDLGDDLGLGVKITPKQVNAFERNIDHPDSLGRIILEMYDLGHKVLLDQEKEGLGFLMVLGCYMEGMHLVMEEAQEHDLLLFIHLLHQQRNYGNNLKQMLDGYEIPLEVQEEYQAFNEVVNSLNASSIPTVYDLKTGKKTVSSIDRGKLEEIESAVTRFRQSILI